MWLTNLKQEGKTMDKTLTYEFLEVMNNFRKLAGQHPSKSKVHMGEFMMLGVIHSLMAENKKKHRDEPGVKVGDLSESMHASKPATSKMLSVIEKKGYIERVADSKDRRVVYIRLSGTGEVLMKDAMDKLHFFAEHTIEKLGEDDAKELIRLLRKLYQTVLEEIKEFKHFDKKTMD